MDTSKLDICQEISRVRKYRIPCNDHLRVGGLYQSFNDLDDWSLGVQSILDLLT